MRVGTTGWPAIGREAVGLGETGSMGQIRWFRTRTPPGSGPTRTLSGVGFALRETRVTAGLELTELARRTGVETRYLRALEWERDDLIPDPGARAAALEAYMREVGLDPSVLDRLAEEPPTPSTEAGSIAPRSGAGTEAPAPAAAPEDFRPWALGEPGTTARSFAWRAEHPPGPARSTGPSVIAWLRDVTGTRAELIRPRPIHLMLVGAALAAIVTLIAVDLLVRGDEAFDPAADEAAAQESSGPAEAPTPAPPNEPTDPAPAPPAPPSTPPASTPGGSASPAASSVEPDPGPGAVDAPPGPIEVTAAGGDAWIQVRAGSATGRVLHEGILPVGQTLRFDRRTIWVRTGAAAFTVISRGDETLLARDELIGTVEVLVTARGLSPA